MPRVTLKKTFLLSCTLCLLQGCGIGATLIASAKCYDDKNDTSIPSIFDDRLLVDFSKKFGVMALFAEAVYRRNSLEGGIGNNDCRYLKGDAPDAAMPYTSDEAGNIIGRWERWLGDAKNTELKPCLSSRGLYYETYVYKDYSEEPPRIKKAVIAFRGTENRVSQLFWDWSANLSALFGIPPHQYRIAAKHVPLVISTLKNTNNNIDIFATGHSLGGGLAQQAGYLSKDIKEVFTFNTTPVTNWSWLRLTGRIKNAHPIVHRLYHGGEVLESARNISTAFSEARYGRHDIGIQVKPKKLIKGHSMSMLACHFARVLDVEKLDGDYEYPHAYISQHVLGSDYKVGDISTLDADFKTGKTFCLTDISSEERTFYHPPLLSDDGDLNASIK